MVDYKDLYKRIDGVYADAPSFLDEVKFKDLPKALELCQVLENEPDGLTLKEINERTIATAFSEKNLETFEDSGIIEKGVLITAVHFKDRVMELDREETRYYLV